MRRHKDALDQVPNGFVSVALAIYSEHHDEREEAKGFVKTLTRDTGWKSKTVHHAAGALKYLEYDFFKRWIMRRIVKTEGGPFDTSQNYEFTDWGALDRYVDTFIANPLSKAS